jgi:predicted ferric reductase
MTKVTRTVDDGFDELASPSSLAWALGGAIVGAIVALIVLPDLVPPLVGSLSGPQPRTWWYLSRASGLVSYAMLALSMLFGLLLSTKVARQWPGAAAAFSLHEHASILALALALFHGLVLLGDRHTPFGIVDVALPFGATHRPLAVGLGQLAFYGVALLVASFHVKKRLGQRAWRLLHFTSFAVFALGLVHGLALGTDRGAMTLGLVAAAPAVFFTSFRALSSLFPDQPSPEATGSTRTTDRGAPEAHLASTRASSQRRS